MSPINQRLLTSQSGGMNDSQFTVVLEKGNCRLGLGLIDGLYTPLQAPGIYIRNIIADSQADKCELLHAGDRIMSVNGTSVVGASYQVAMDYIRSTGQEITLVITRSNRDVIDKILAAKS